MRRRQPNGSTWKIRPHLPGADTTPGHHLRNRPALHLAAQFAAVAAAIGLLLALFFAGGYPPARTQASAGNLPPCSTFGPEAAVAVWPNTWCVSESGPVYYELKQRNNDCVESRTMRISRFFDSQGVQIATRLDVEPWVCVAASWP